MLKRLAFLLAFVASLWLAVLPVRAWFAGGGNFQGFNVGGDAAPPTLTFLQCTAGTFAFTTVMTVAAQNIGTASSDRTIIIGFLGEDATSSWGVDSITVGGDAATEVIDETGSGVTNTALYIMSNPTGTSEDVVVTASEAITANNAAVCLWSVTGLSSLTAVSSVADDANGSFATTILTLGSSGVDGVAVGVCGSSNNVSQTVTWAVLTERTESDSGDMQTSAADLSPTNGSGLSVTCAWTSNGDFSGVAAAFR